MFLSRRQETWRVIDKESIENGVPVLFDSKVISVLTWDPPSRLPTMVLPKITAER